MRFFVKSIATGFAMSLGAALFKKLSKKLDLDGEEAKAKAAEEKASKKKTNKVEPDAEENQYD